MATIANMLTRCNEFQARIGKYSIKKIDVFPLLRDIINKLREATGQELEDVLTQPFQVLIAKDIEAGTAQDYDLILGTRDDIIIDSLVVMCDAGTLTGCSLKIDGVAVEIATLATFSVSAVKTTLAATGANTAVAGSAVTIHTSVGFTGTPTTLKVQLNFSKVTPA